jgi:hypothetical protein
MIKNSRSETELPATSMQLRVLKVHSSMRSRNVIVSLIIVLTLLVFLFVKINYREPKKQVTLNRNPARVEYAETALCQMDCYNITAGHVTRFMKNATVISAKPDEHRAACTTFAIRDTDDKARVWIFTIKQCGKTIRILTCTISGGVFVSCDCADEEKPILSN